MKYKVGDILKSKEFFGEITILAVLGTLYAFKGAAYLGVIWEEERWFEKKGYIFAQPARWVPKLGEDYNFMNDYGEPGIKPWSRDKRDLFRLSINNVFQVGDHAGIEALKRKWQEGNV